MKTYKVHTPWQSLIVEATDERQAKIAAVAQLLVEIQQDNGNSLDIEEVE